MVETAAGPLREWSRSGAMALTGWPDRDPLGPPDGLPRRLRTLAEHLGVVTQGIGRQLCIDPLALLTERAALLGLGRRGTISCGGNSHMLRAADGWLALSLARSSDAALLPAWLESEPKGVLQEGSDSGTIWEWVAEQVALRSATELEGRAALLGLPVGVLGSRGLGEAEAKAWRGLPVVGKSLGVAPPRSVEDLVVVDLSSLWAGPLCSRILDMVGARVIKVESRSRPDGARSGQPGFFDLMNAGKESVCLDLGRPEGAEALRALLGSADVVIEASRPRALAQMGVDAEALGRHGPQVWVSITGYGRDGEDGVRVALGDDAAVAGGLVAWSEGMPLFCADAIADPCTGLVAAAAAAEALASGGRWLIDVPMVAVAAELAGPTLDAAGVEALEPPPPSWRGRASALGAHNDRLLSFLPQWE